MSEQDVQPPAPIVPAEVETPGVPQPAGLSAHQVTPQTPPGPTEGSSNGPTLSSEPLEVTAATEAPPARHDGGTSDAYAALNPLGNSGALLTEAPGDPEVLREDHVGRDALPVPSPGGASADGSVPAAQPPAAGGGTASEGDFPSSSLGPEEPDSLSRGGSEPATPSDGGASGEVSPPAPAVNQSVIAVEADSGNEYPGLSPKHAALLRASAITPTVAAARGYRTVNSGGVLAKLGFYKTQCLTPGLLIPLHGADGSVVGHQLRPDAPRTLKGRICKYEFPAGRKLPIDVPPAARAALMDVAVPLYVTEGVRKADAAVARGLCCVAQVGGVYGGGGNDDFWQRVPLKSRPVRIAFDSDIGRNPQVKLAADRLAKLLRGHGAEVAFVRLEDTPSGEKVGLDDFFAAGKSVDDLLRLVSADTPPAAASGGPRHPYRVVDGGLVWDKSLEGKLVPVRLTNFDARITADRFLDDGLERSREYEVTVSFRDRTARGPVRAEDFERMNWVATLAGAGAVISPGVQCRDHARAAIQYLSGDVPETVVRTALGWVADGKGYAFVHAGGAIRADVPAEGEAGGEDRPACNAQPTQNLRAGGPMGPIPDARPGRIEVRVAPALRGFRLPEPPAGKELDRALRACLHYLGHAPPRITYPLAAAVWRAVLGPVDWSVFLVGPSGVFKSEEAALVQQHFGAGMDSRHLPGSWNSTANSLAELAFQAKDAVMVVDDFVPKGSAADVDRQHRDADLLLRAQGNGAGRGRMARDGSLRQARPPRGLLVCTGEERPRGHSLMARVLAIDVGPRDVPPVTLTACQHDARSGLYAGAMAAFLRWLAPTYGDALSSLGARRDEKRGAFTHPDRHARGAGILADLAVGFEFFLDFALEAGTIDENEFEEHWTHLENALIEVGAHHGLEQRLADPVDQFLAYLAAALLTGRAHLELDDKLPPDDYGALVGWHRVTVPTTVTTDDGSTEEGTKDVWQRKNPTSKQLGWIYGDGVYLLPAPTVGVAAGLADEAGEPLHLTDRTLGKRLADRGLLLKRSEDRYTVKLPVNGGQVRVWHLSLNSVIELWQGNASLTPDQLQRLGHDLLADADELLA